MASPHISHVRVRYAETDQMGIGHHSQFILWLEVARTEMLRDLGFTYKNMEDEGFILPVVEVNIRYRSPAYYDDLLKIETRVKELGRVKVEFAYEIYREDGTHVATATTVLGCLSRATRKPIASPQDIRDALQKTMA